MKTRLSVGINIALALILSAVLLGQFGFSSNEPASSKDSAAETVPDNRPVFRSPALPLNLDFCGEAVPLDRWDVRERLDREILFNSYYASNILYTLKLANRYFPVISERLKANGIPDDFKYLAIAESNLVATAISRSGATSFWQFLDKTAPEYGLTVNKEIDLRYDIEKSTDAACKYFKQAYSKFGSWTAAAASYNCGQTGYGNRAEFQRTQQYYDLHLPEETNRYIFRILAFKYLMENAGALGYQLEDNEKYPVIPYKTVTVDSTIPDLAEFAIRQGTSYKILKLMNPWIKDKSLTVSSNRQYTLKVPLK